MTFFLVLYVLEGLGMMAAAVPFILRRVKRNTISGVRLPATLRDDDTWYRVNEKFGRGLFLLGAVFALAAIGFHFIPGIGGTIVAYNLSCLAVLLVGFTAVTVAALSFLRKS